MSSSPAASLLRRSSLSDLSGSPTGSGSTSMHTQASCSAFLGYEMPSLFCSSSATSSHELRPSVDNFYSPPPSPPPKTFIPRFESPSISYISNGTPSLLEESLPSAISSPFLNHTPMPYTTTRDSRLDTTNLVGLGIRGLFTHTDCVFNGMSVLPRRDECAGLGFFMDEADEACCCGGNEGKGYPEHEEDAWRKRISASFTNSISDCSNDPGQFSLCPSSTCWSPRAASSPFKTSSRNKGSCPMEPEMDDVFFRRSPAASTSPSGSMATNSIGISKERLEISRAVVFSWFRSVRSPGPDGIEEASESMNVL